MIRVVLPQHLRTLAATGAEVALELSPPITIRRTLDALEARYPTLRGTIREYGTGQRRAFLRFFVCEEDWSHESVDAELGVDHRIVASVTHPARAHRVIDQHEAPAQVSFEIGTVAQVRPGL